MTAHGFRQGRFSRHFHIYCPHSQPQTRPIGNERLVLPSLPPFPFSSPSVSLPSSTDYYATLICIQDVDHLPCVVLTNEETHFWRYICTVVNEPYTISCLTNSLRPQTKTTSHLATIEAIYYFFRETCQPPE